MLSHFDFYFFIPIFIFVLANGDIQTLWDNAGCTSDGLISPSNVPYFWRTVKNQEEFIGKLQSKLDQSDAMASVSCYGSVKGERKNSYSDSFHLLWECQEASSTCILPPTHALCVRTLRQVHPDATIKLWSTTLDEDSLSNTLQGLDIQLTRYDISYFDDLPQAAQKAAVDMQDRMHSKDANHARENSFSHWSDLFRAAVLYKEGGVYTDLDSIWLRPISELASETEWIPKTPAFTEVDNEEDAVEIENQRYFLEGGIMRFDEPKSPFLKNVLENFPKYDQEAAECWACVGPRQLTRTYNNMDERQPALIDSAKVFGVRDYRTYFANMFREFDPVIWSEILNSDEVAAHLFTASPQTGISKDSTIFNLLRVGGVDGATDNSASWRHVKEQRRNLLSSLYYLNYGSSSTDDQYGPPGSTDSVIFSLDFTGVNNVNFQLKEAEIKLALASQLQTSEGNIQLLGSDNFVQATVYTEDAAHAAAVTAAVEDSMFVTELNSEISDPQIFVNTVSTPSTGTHDAVIGDGSVIYFYGNSESVTANVLLTDNVAMPSYISEIRNIFMGSFDVPLSAVSASQTADNVVTVTVNGIITAYARENFEEVNDAIAASTVLPNGSSLEDVEIPPAGYTQATVVVSKAILSHADNLDAILLSYGIAKESFDLDEDVQPTSELLYTVTGSVECAVRVSWTATDVANAYTDDIARMLKIDDTESVVVEAQALHPEDLMDNGAATFTISFSTFLDASNNRTYIIDKPEPFEIGTNFFECYWHVDDIRLRISTFVQKEDTTQTEMIALSETAQGEYEQNDFTFDDLTIESFGQQEIGACEMLEECRADYSELYEMLSGAFVEKVTENEVEQLGWWWDFQIGRYLTMRGQSIVMNDVRQKDGFFYYRVDDDTFINTCVQHAEAWADQCDTSIGVCAGQGNYGFSSQQATSLTEALDKTSNVHPNCPSGCQSLDDSWSNELKRSAPSISSDMISSLCVTDNKYYLWLDPLTIVDTCVGYSGSKSEQCPLSDYVFCSDIDYESGSVVYGNTTYQGYSLENALSTTNHRHPQCL